MESSFSFDIQRSRIQQAILFESFFRAGPLRVIRKISQWVLVIVGIIFAVLFIPEEPAVSERTLQVVLAVVFFLFSYTGIAFILEKFGQSLRTVHPAPTDPNLADFLSFRAAVAVSTAVKFAARGKYENVNSSFLLFQLLRHSSRSSRS